MAPEGGIRMQRANLQKLNKPDDTVLNFTSFNFRIMGFSHLAILILLSLRACSTPAQIQVEEVEDDDTPAVPNLAVQISTSFPSSEIFGIKLVNGHPTQALLSIQNDEPDPVTLVFIGGSLWASVQRGKGPQIVKNLTTARFNVAIPAGAKESISYSFTTVLQPQDLKLNLAAVVQDQKGAAFTLQAFNETVSVVEPDTSIFDPQIIFLYLVLLSVFGGTCYFIYSTWISTLFPQKRRSGKGGERAKKSSGGSKNVDPNDQVSVLGADGPAVTTSSKAYDESWIPQHHINKPETRRVKSSGPKPKAKVELK